MKLLFISVFAFLFVSCNNKKDEKQEPIKAVTDTLSAEITERDLPSVQPEITSTLVGKWVVIDGDFNEEMTKEEKEKIIGKATVEFFADGNFVAISPEENDNDKGTYSFDAKANKLTINSEEGDIQLFSITWINGKLKMTGEEGSMILKRSGN